MNLLWMKWMLTVFRCSWWKSLNEGVVRLLREKTCLRLIRCGGYSVWPLVHNINTTARSGCCLNTPFPLRCSLFLFGLLYTPFHCPGVLRRNGPMVSDAACQGAGQEKRHGWVGGGVIHILGILFIIAGGIWVGWVENEERDIEGELYTMLQIMFIKGEGWWYLWDW